MNDKRSVFGSRWWQTYRQPLIAGLLVAFISKGIAKYGDMALVESLIQYFVIELWPIWFGIAVGMLSLGIRTLVNINSFIRAGLKFDKKLNELDQERRELMTHVHTSYSGLSLRFDKSINLLSDRIDKLESQSNNT